MSQHRYPCTAEPPPPILADSDHQHACIHDEPVQPVYRPVEHKCVCGMTWRASDWTPRPAPDISWITMNTKPAWPVWRGIAVVGGIPVAVIAAVMVVAWLVAR